MDQQKAFRGELYLAVFYKTAAVLSSGYLLVEIGKLLTGNLETLSSHPELLAGLCLVSGFALVNLCRNRSPIFWKRVDLLWIITFVPSLVVSVVLYQQENYEQVYSRELLRSIDQNQGNVDDWKAALIGRCKSPDSQFHEVCNLLPNFTAQTELHGIELRSYKALIEATERETSDWPISLYRAIGDHTRKRLEVAIDALVDELKHSHIARTTSLSPLPEEPVKFGSKEFWWLVSKLRELDLAQTIDRVKTNTEGSLDEELLSEARELAELIASMTNTIVSFVEIRAYYENHIEGMLPNSEFIPLFITCFVFPFRVGKSIYDIKVEKDKQNAPVSS